MFYKKWTFSLVSLVILLMIGLMSPATAGILGENFKVELKVTDVSSEGGIQVEYDQTDATPPVVVPNQVTVMVSLAKEITDAEAIAADKFMVTAYDHNGGLLDSPTQSVRAPGGTATLTTTSTAKMYDLVLTGTTVAHGNTIVISVAKDAFTNANQADAISALHPDNSLGKNERAQLVFTVVDEDNGAPTVLSISRVDPSTVSPFAPVGVTGPFSVQVVLSEMPKAFTAADHIEATNAKVDSVAVGAPIYSIDLDGNTTTTGDVLNGDANGTGRGDGTAAPDAGVYDNRRMLQSYLVMLTPDLKKNDDIVISVKEFEDMVLPVSNRYRPAPVASLTDDMGKLTLKVDPAFVKADPDIFKPSNDGRLPHEVYLSEKLVIPANGFLVLAQGNEAQSGVRGSPAKIADKKAVGQDKYNVKHEFGFPYPGDDLENYFRNGATIQLVYQDIPGNTAGADGDTGYAGASSAGITAGDVIINEIMWGRDRGLGETGDRNKSQWIELHNTTDAAISIDKNEWSLVFGTTSYHSSGTVVDTAGNNPASGYWAAPGQGGATQATADINPGAAIVDLISMSRMTGSADGTAAASWAVSELPSANITAQRNHIATPGAANNYAMPEVVVVPPPPPPPPPAPTPVATKDDIDITEIMFDSGNGRFPQWVELTNVSGKEVSLDGWSLNIDNGDDADALGSSLVIDLSGNTLGVSEHAGNMGKGQSLLVIAFSGRGSDNLGDVAIIDASGADQLNQTGRYMLLSETAFKLVLMPPQMSGITVYGDMAGNLDNGAATWALPMAEGMRSSLIRREMDAANMMTYGTAANGWRLASMTDLASGQITWYGSDEDAGTPGYDAGGPLPVELSMFYPKRDQLTGQVVITWETQSELNNAGFYIKRSEAQDGKFVVINPTMIAGAGTTSEKQSYTYTDTTAKPNIVYYYQIEDVSLDGQRQTLTLGTRLRGHIGAAGKLTTSWGELKSQE